MEVHEAYVAKHTHMYNIVQIIRRLVVRKDSGGADHLPNLKDLANAAALGQKVGQQRC